MQFNSLADYVKTDCTGHDILPIATIIYIKGGVTHRSNQNSRLEKGESIYRGTVVVTDSDGFVAMALNNGETINLQPSTITEFSCAGGISKQAEYKVELSYLSAAIRG